MHAFPLTRKIRSIIKTQIPCYTLQNATKLFGTLRVTPVQSKTIIRNTKHHHCIPCTLPLNTLLSRLTVRIRCGTGGCGLSKGEVAGRFCWGIRRIPRDPCPFHLLLRLLNLGIQCRGRKAKSMVDFNITMFGVSRSCLICRVFFLSLVFSFQLTPWLCCRGAPCCRSSPADTSHSSHKLNFRRSGAVQGRPRLSQA